jgi:transglutaminase-like putative cysteine protease
VCFTLGVYRYNGVVRTALGKLPPGDLGTRKTLELMQAFAQQGAKELGIREAAIQAVRAAGAPEHDAAAQLEALHRFVRDQILFIGDIAGVETLQSPRYTLQMRAGDCDDRAVLLAALARSIGIPAVLKFKVIAANPSQPGTFSHVYVVANVAGRDLALDPTFHGNPAGYEYPRASRSMEMNVWPTAS